MSCCVHCTWTDENLAPELEALRRHGFSVVCHQWSKLTPSTRPALFPVTFAILHLGFESFGYTES